MTIDKRVIETLKPETQKLVRRYKALPAKDRVSILMAISKLLKMEGDGNPPSKETMHSVLTETGQCEIALACYTAQLCGINWK